MMIDKYYTQYVGILTKKCDGCACYDSDMKGCNESKYEEAVYETEECCFMDNVTYRLKENEEKS